MFFELTMFSSWIFLWFILYYCNILSYNPFIFLIIAFIIGTSYGIYYFIINKTKKEIIHKYIIINFVGKIIPAILIYNNKISINDIYFGLILYIFFIIFIIINKLHIINEYHLYYNSMLHKNDNIYISNIIYDFFNINI